MLHAAGLPVYRHLNVHGYWKMGEGVKMSKSRGNVVKPLDLKDRYGVEAFRYFVMREMSFGLDATFSEEALVTRLNGDLANDLGNLFARGTAMIERYCGGVAPRGLPAGPAERGLIDLARETVAIYRVEMGQLNFHLALKAVWEYITALNRYIVDNAPWEQAKDPARKPELDRTLRNLLFGLVRVAYLIWPVMPATGEEMLKRLGTSLVISEQGLDYILGAGVDPAGLKVAKGPAFFPRVETKAEAERPAAEPAQPPAPALPAIDMEEFARVALRVGHVLDCRRPEGSKKLLVCEVDLGEEKPRQILAGLAEHYAPEEMKGQWVVVVANLKARKMMGLESQGMILAAVSGATVKLIRPPKGVKPGTVVR
jgi:methionyl-tRNA synthetase